jgi:hypothetical protein
MTAPLLLLSELRRQMNSEPSSSLSAGDRAAADLRLRELIRSASGVFTQEANGRRFDRRYETRYYTPYNIQNDGDLLSSIELMLDADLRAVFTLTNGDDSTISSDDYQLIPRNSAEKSAIRLTPFRTVSWMIPSTDDPVGSIEVAGLWGYGGEWISAGDTVQDDPLTATATTMNVTDGGNFEVDMVVRFGASDTNAEYALVTGIATNVVTITRGYNGTTAAAHVKTTPLYYYRASDIVRRQIVRLCTWALEQAKSPMFGQSVVADVQIPTTIDTLPNDVRRVARQLRWPMRVVAV